MGSRRTFKRGRSFLCVLGRSFLLSWSKYTKHAKKAQTSHEKSPIRSPRLRASGVRHSERQAFQNGISVPECESDPAKIPTRHPAEPARRKIAQPFPGLNSRP